MNKLVIKLKPKGTNMKNDPPKDYNSPEVRRAMNNIVKGTTPNFIKYHHDEEVIMVSELRKLYKRRNRLNRYLRILSKTLLIAVATFITTLVYIDQASAHDLSHDHGNPNKLGTPAYYRAQRSKFEYADYFKRSVLGINTHTRGAQYYRDRPKSLKKKAWKTKSFWEVRRSKGYRR